MNAAFARQLEEFERWHQHPGNRLCHDVGLPLITLATLGAGSHVPLLGADLSLWLLGGTLVLDLVIVPRLAVGVTGMGLLLYWIGRGMSAPWLAAAFIGGWIAQLVGHRLVERNAPAFTDNLVHLMIGPRWLVRRWARLLRRRPS